MRYVAENGLASVCRPVIVVVGSRARDVGAALKGCDVETVENAGWAEGMGGSIQAGIAAAEQARAAILMLADRCWWMRAY